MTLQEAFEAALGDLRAGRNAEAASTCRRILAAEPRADAALHLLGLIAGQAGRFGEAVELISRAISINPSFAAYHVNLGEIFRRQGAWEPALSAYREAIELQPQYALAWANAGVVLTSLGRTREAVEAHRRLVELEPASAEAHENLSAACSADGDAAGACEAAARAVRLDPGRATAHANLGAALLQLARADEAAAALRTAVSLGPALAKAHWNLGLALLTRGDWEQGWAEYEWRWKCDGLTKPRGFRQPAWGGEPLGGRTILLHAEQGIGDTLQFVRYAPLVAARGGRVVVECHPDLAALLAGVAGVLQVVPGGEPLPPFDVYCPMLNLPRLFDTRPTSVPAAVPYVHANPARVEHWSGRIADAVPAQPSDGRAPPRLRVGLVWAGSPGHLNDRNRSVTLARMAPLAGVSNPRGVHFYSLQRGPAAGQAAHPPPRLDLIDWSDELTDLSDTAALVENLDLVIAVDTAVAHLAGALGKPAWVLLPFAPDWRWLLGREDTPWYPTMRLFRQPAAGDWDAVFKAVAGELAHFGTGAPR